MLSKSKWPLVGGRVESELEVVISERIRDEAGACLN
jgi:hypothetical protein